MAKLTQSLSAFASEGEETKGSTFGAVGKQPYVTNFRSFQLIPSRY
jgi:hypothetical protein